MLTNSSSLRDVVASLIGLINLTIPVLITLIVVLFMWAGVRYIYTADQTEGKGPEREALLWGLVALFVVFSVWGILRLLCSTFLGGSGC